MSGQKPVLLVSDLHLPPGPSPLREGFLHWLHSDARRAEAVYLLGDLFEYWIGDDVGLAHYGPEVDALSSLSTSGVPVWVQHGNRDFLLGSRFEQATGARLLADPVIHVLGGVPTLLSHGDLWCTADVGYQRFRRFSRQYWAQRIFLALPRRWRESVAGGLRDRSRQHTPMKAESITDVEPAAVVAACHAAGVSRVIHGHTHRPALHHTDGIERLVLPDWRPGIMGGWNIWPGGRLEPFALTQAGETTP